MASSHKIFVLVALALVFIALNSSTSIVESRKLSNPNSNLMSLEARLKVSGDEPSNCWESLFKLQACSGEIITFFLNGETYLGYGCCKAIRVIGHDCWPNVVASLGFTNEETDLLEGYCDQVEDVHSPPPPPTPLASLVKTKEILP
ncbi:putative Prolamin-like domain-containing protein [Medicago truncatula]|uniref:ECA1 gametogenesis related family n=1 Tax=Medicago truncatula TaxID=3880 RepID=G7IZZ9_MEDTR|nr:egg cell-secreted protein 1.2 [Medicago truncatula]AES70181.1 ECA1 gametogenesis related family [Medicago truncatula]RHN66994.1 putative Prolamin-like domain-containing protein [Medicago truncatula]